MATSREVPTTQLKQPRLADMVAAILRERIIGGAMEPGETLPKQEDLLNEFNVSLPSLREAMRILESEGLISVRRGKTGGAIVHGPQPQSAAQMLGFVLQSRQVSMEDLSRALRQLEPVCAALCAQRPDRHEVVVKPLKALHEQCGKVLDSPVDFTRVAREFHEKMIHSCGNETLILVVGALDHLWSARQENWDRYMQRSTKATERSVREAGHEIHAQLIQAIEAGDAHEVRTLLEGHLENSPYYEITGELTVKVV